jgi:hypothetical protein
MLVSDDPAKRIMNVPSIYKLCQSLKPQEALNLVSYRGVLVNTLLHAAVYMFLYNLLNVLVQIANEMGIQKKKS